MTDITKQLADALAELLACRPSTQAEHCEDFYVALTRLRNAYVAAETALAAYQAQQAAPSEQPAQGELPPLPIEWRKVEDADGIQVPVFRAFQMWDYARAALAQRSDQRSDQPAQGEREAFEAWFSEDGKWAEAVRRKGDGYMLAYADSAWAVWQARAALAQRPALVALTREQKLTLAGNYFSEPWVIQYAIDLMHDYEQMVGITSPKAQEGE